MFHLLLGVEDISNLGSYFAYNNAQRIFYAVHYLVSKPGNILFNFLENCVRWKIVIYVFF